jgi:hypothetical protein
MNAYDFIIQYKKGSEMPADFLSRNVLDEIDVFSPDLPLLQARDEFANAVIEFLQHNKKPADKKKATYIANIAKVQDSCAPVRRLICQVTAATTIKKQRLP